jgi:DNA-binding CsgD family transcriptional regulator/PAS domain-containing protein
VADAQDLLAVVGLLYEAALNPERWPTALAGYADLIGARGAHLVMFEKATGSPLLGVVAGYAEDGNVEYITHYAASDERLPRFRALAHGQLSQNRVLYSEDDRRRSATYNEFLGKYDGQEQLLVRLDGPDATEIAISGIRSVRDGPYEAEEFALATAVVTHFERAIVIQAQMGKLNGAQGAAEGALERTPNGVVLLDEAARVLFANRAAVAICAAGDGLAIADGMLCAMRAPENAALQRLIGGAIATGLGHGTAPGGVLALPRPSGKRPYAVVVTPTAQTPLLLIARRPAAMAFLTDPETAPALAREVLQRLFGLTRREIDLAVRLATGERLDDAANRLGFTTATARTYLKQLLRKTDTHSQAQLVALLLRIPPLTGKE